MIYLKKVDCCVMNVTAGLENRLGVKMVLINPIVGLAMEKMEL